MKKVVKYDLAIIILISIISESDFCSYLIPNIIGEILDLIVRISFIIYALYKIYKKNVGKILFKNPKLKILIVLPIYLICFSNFYVALLEKQSITSISTIDFFIVIKVILTALCEEITFRAILQKEIEKYKVPLKSLFISSLIFSLVHLLNISSLASIPICLLQALYSFGIGLLSGFIYLYTDNFILPVLFHFMFNFMNDTLVTSIYNIDYSLMFFVVNIIVAILGAIYILLILRRLNNASKYMDI